MNSLWAAACGGWVLGMFQGAAVVYLALTHNRRKERAAMLRRKADQLRQWVAKNFVAVALIVIVLSNGLGWLVILDQNSTDERQDVAIAGVAACTGRYLARDADARDARSNAVKPRDEAEARFIKAVASLRGSDGTDPEGDAEKVEAIFKATEDFEKAKAELDKVRAVDYPTYTCDKDR